MSQDLPERLRDYLNEKHKNEEGFRPYEIMKGQVRNEKWFVYTEWRGGCGIRERMDGTIWVTSSALNYLGDWLLLVLSEPYKHRMWSVKSEDEEEKICDELHKKADPILEDILHRRNLNKYLKEKDYRDIIIDVLWSDEIARRISQEFKIEVKCLMDDVKWKTYFCSAFDSKGINEDQKFEEIVKRIEAVRAAYKMYRLYDEMYDESEDYKKFKERVLAELELG